MFIWKKLGCCPSSCCIRQSFDLLRRHLPAQPDQPQLQTPLREYTFSFFAQTSQSSSPCQAGRQPVSARPGDPSGSRLVRQANLRLNLHHRAPTRLPVLPRPLRQALNRSLMARQRTAALPSRGWARPRLPTARQRCSPAAHPAGYTQPTQQLLSSVWHMISW